MVVGIMESPDRVLSCQTIIKRVAVTKIRKAERKWAGELKPLSHQTAMPQRLVSVLKPCQRAMVSPRNTPKNIKFVSYSVYTTSSQRPYSVHTTFPQRLYSAHDVITAHKQLLQRVHGAHTARSGRAHGAHTASSGGLKRLRCFTYFYFILSNPILQT